ncbi:18414_t:CDS:2, partial [Funneliformis geosporum]
FNALTTNPHTLPNKRMASTKRYKAHLIGTTYAYDFPELFRQAIRILWNRTSHHSSNLKYPSDVLKAKEPTELARSLGIPRVYLSANSGARIGLAEEVMNHFNQLHQNEMKSVITEEIVEEGETRHKITNIIGSKDGLGVEYLKVTCHSVGIRVYSVRLGQGTIQNKQWSSHLTAQNDLEGITKIIQWLLNSPVPIFMNSDTWDRDVNYMPPKGPYDSRWLIAGKYEI